MRARRHIGNAEHMRRWRSERAERIDRNGAERRRADGRRRWHDERRRVIGVDAMWMLVWRGSDMHGGVLRCSDEMWLLGGVIGVVRRSIQIVLTMRETRTPTHRAQLHQFHYLQTTWRTQLTIVAAACLTQRNKHAIQFVAMRLFHAFAGYFQLLTQAKYLTGKLSSELTGLDAVVNLSYQFNQFVYGHMRDTVREEIGRRCRWRRRCRLEFERLRSIRSLSGCGHTYGRRRRRLTVVRCFQRFGR